MAEYTKDGFVFFDGFFNTPVFNLDNWNIENKVEYILRNNIKNISLDQSLDNFDFLRKINFIEEIYISENICEIDLYQLKQLKRMIVNVKKNKPQIDYSQFPELEYLSVDWYNKFPTLVENKKLKGLILWKFRPKERNFKGLCLPESIENIEITESNINSLEGLSLPNLKKVEVHYCRDLETLNGIELISATLESLIVEHCRNLTDYYVLSTCIYLKKIILGDCGDIPNLNWLTKLKKVEHFSFWGTKLLDGNVTPCYGINYVNFKDAKHYNHKAEDFVK